MASTINILNKKKNIYKQKNKQTKKQTKNKKTVCVHRILKMLIHRTNNKVYFFINKFY